MKSLQYQIFFQKSKHKCRLMICLISKVLKKDRKAKKKEDRGCYKSTAATI
jgi:hypothetical protein